SGGARARGAGGARPTDSLAPPAHEVMVGLAHALRGDVPAARACLAQAGLGDLASHAAYALRTAGLYGLAAADAVIDAAADVAGLPSALESLVAIDPADAGAHRLPARPPQPPGDRRAAAHQAAPAFLGAGA